MANSGYVGYVPSKKDTVARESSDINPALFYTNYVKARRPVVLSGFPSGEGSARLRNLGNLSYLRKAARDSKVKIEPFNKTSRTFGTNLERRSVPFPEFLDMLQDEGQRGQWYLTTQYDDEDSATYNNEGPTLDRVCPAPTDKLVNDFPAQPSLMGNLLLQQCNLWIGNSKEGSSSGLHHDFHDNLYLLLRGRKRFVLYPPSAYAYLHLRGSVEKVWGNGLLCYSPADAGTEDDEAKDESTLRADGLVEDDALRWRCAFWLNKIAKAAGVPSEPAGRLSRWPYDYPAHQIFCEKQSLASLSGSMKKAIAGCRKAFGVLTEATGVDYSEPPDVSDIETHDIAIGESGETDSETGDATPLFGDPGMDDSWSEDEGTENFDGLQDDFDELEHEMAMGPSTSTKWGVQQTKPEPPSFSRITPAALHRLLGFEDDFTPSSPKAVKKTNKNKQRAGLASDGLLPLKGCPPPLVVYLEPGEMLYLPASWFHEVTSSSDDTGNENVHVAFNYWFHPPDAFLWTPDKDTFEQPYADKQAWSAISHAVDRQLSDLRAAIANDTQDGDNTKRAQGGTGVSSAGKSKKRRLEVDLLAPTNGRTRPKRNRPKPAARVRKMRWAKRYGAVDRNA